MEKTTGLMSNPALIMNLQAQMIREGGEESLRLKKRIATLENALRECRTVLVVDNEYAEDSASVLAIDEALDAPPQKEGQNEKHNPVG
jgi:hypothetical protein